MAETLRDIGANVTPLRYEGGKTRRVIATIGPKPPCSGVVIKLRDMIPKGPPCSSYRFALREAVFGSIAVRAAATDRPLAL
jgi:hypothetical protein